MATPNNDTPVMFDGQSARRITRAVKAVERVPGLAFGRNGAMLANAGERGDTLFVRASDPTDGDLGLPVVDAIWLEDLEEWVDGGWSTRAVIRNPDGTEVRQGGVYRVTTRWSTSGGMPVLWHGGGTAPQPEYTVNASPSVIDSTNGVWAYTLTPVTVAAGVVTPIPDADPVTGYNRPELHPGGVLGSLGLTPSEATPSAVPEGVLVDGDAYRVDAGNGGTETEVRFNADNPIEFICEEEAL
jgi:hypothetical protein